MSYEKENGVLCLLVGVGSKNLCSQDHNPRGTRHAFAVKLRIKNAGFLIACLLFIAVICGRREREMSVTHPFSVQKQVDFEDHAVVDRDLLVSVQDLKYPAEHSTVVDPRRAEAAFV